MSAKKPNSRKPAANKLEPIDWREFANDAVLNGNMSTLYRRPPTEDPSAYASPEALVEIEKRVIRREPAPSADTEPTVGPVPAVSPVPTGGPTPPEGTLPTVGPVEETALAGSDPTAGLIPTVSVTPTVGSLPTVGPTPTVGDRPKKVKPIREVQDALTLAGQVLYRALLGPRDGAPSRSCTKGYRQLAAETRLDKDTVRDLLAEFKNKGIVREIATYDADTRLAKTYEVLADQAVLALWRTAGLQYVTAGRQRPLFCSPQGEILVFTPTVGTKP